MCYALKNIICKGVHTDRQKVKEHQCHKKLKNLDMLVEMDMRSLDKSTPDQFPVTAIPNHEPSGSLFPFL